MAEVKGCLPEVGNAWAGTRGVCAIVKPYSYTMAESLGVTIDQQRYDPPREGSTYESVLPPALKATGSTQTGSRTCWGVQIM